MKAAPGTAAEQCRELAAPSNELGRHLRQAERAILIWSGPGGAGGCHLSDLALELGIAKQDGSGALYLPATPNGRGVADAWAAAADEEPADPEPIKLLIVSGDEAASNPGVRVLAEQAESVLAITMFQGVAVGWADLVLPGTSYLEREGTYVNLEGRPQRLRRASIPPAPDELAWLAKLAERFGVELSPYPSIVFEELSAVLYGGLSFAEIGERAPLPARAPADAVGQSRTQPPEQVTLATAAGGPLRLLRYRPLFSGLAVERTPELQFQRPAPEIELSPVDAAPRGIGGGDPVNVSSNGTSTLLRARLEERLVAGVVRIAEEHADGLHGAVEVTKA